MPSHLFRSVIREEGRMASHHFTSQSMMGSLHEEGCGDYSIEMVIMKPLVNMKINLILINS